MANIIWKFELNCKELEFTFPELFAKLNLNLSSFFLFVPAHVTGKVKGIAFIKDPDGYWIEIFDTKSVANGTAQAAGWSLCCTVMDAFISIFAPEWMYFLRIS